MGLFNTPNLDFSALIAELQNGNSEIINSLTLLQTAFNSLQFNQPPLTMTSPAPFNIPFAPGEIKEVIPASTSPRRIIIKSVSGECKLLLGTAENIELSAISVKGDRLVDERWQGNIFGYSANGAEILVNIEVETINNDEEEEMPVPLVIEPYMHSDLSLLLSGDTQEKIIDNDNLAGYKMFRALSFDPGTTYNFNIQFGPNVSSTISSVIFYNINIMDLVFATYTRLIEQVNSNNFYEVIKQTSKKETLTLPGSFNATFFNTRFLGLFYVLHSVHGWRAADIDYNSTNQTFSILGI